MPVKVLIADDHSMVRKGIRALLEDENEIEVVGEAIDGREALDLIARLNPDLVLLDITMPEINGIEVTRQVSAHHPQTRVLIFSMHDKTDYILNAVQYGASGFLLKDTNDEEIISAIRTIHRGELYFPAGISSVIIKNLVKIKLKAEQVADDSPLTKLTTREFQILDCLKEGMNNQEIARRFDTSPNTVANQRTSILKKTGVKNTAELISLAMRDSR